MSEQIFDPIRKKWLVKTPEELVRQTLILYLHNNKKVPYHLMSCEFPIYGSGTKSRADLVVFKRDGSPLLLAECKAPEEKIDQSVFEQILRYNRMLNVSYLIITNGKSTHFAAKDLNTGTYIFADDIPNYETLTQQ